MVAMLERDAFTKTIRGDRVKTSECPHPEELRETNTIWAKAHARPARIWKVLVTCKRCGQTEVAHVQEEST